VLWLGLMAGPVRSDDFSSFVGPYLGMKPPGSTPDLFAPGVVSDVFWEHSGAVFTPDGNELFWSVALNEGRSPRIIVILHMQRGEQGWSAPELAPFNNAPYNHINSVSPDGKRLYFFSSSDEEPSRARHCRERGARGAQRDPLHVRPVRGPSRWAWHRPLSIRRR
jgi:hypothetical protein